MTVPEPHRRHRVGSALLAALEERACAAGRAYVLVEVLTPVDVVGPGELLAAAKGYPVANREGAKVLDLRDHPDWAPVEARPERLRRNELRSHDLGRRRFCAAAFAPDGTLAGYSDLFVPAYVEEYAQIGITMVLPEHRGRSLCLALKLATRASLVAALLTCGLMATGNADVNEAMNAVNEQMCYRLVEQLLEVQKSL